MKHQSYLTLRRNHISSRGGAEARRTSLPPNQSRSRRLSHASRLMFSQSSLRASATPREFFALICLFIAPSFFTFAQAADPLPIALVNIDRILKDYKPLNDKLDPLKAEAKELESAIQVRQAEIETVGNQLRQTLPGSPDQQRLQIQLVKLQGDFQRF